MLTIDDVIKLYLTKDEILLCLQKTKKNSFIDNLRIRHPNVQFDCKLRGYIGELAISKWFSDNKIEVSATDFLQDGDSIDIDFIIKNKNVELKTSLIPDKDGVLEKVIERRDIKLIKRGNTSIEGLKGDIHMQIYFHQQTKAKDSWLQKQEIDLNSNDLEYLYKAIGANAYLRPIYFVAWIDKPTLVDKINALPLNQRYWSFPNSQRFFWNCKLCDSKKPIELIEFIKKI